MSDQPASAEGPTPLLQVDDLSVEFKIEKRVLHAVNHVSFDINPGEVVGIVGESGSGKSVSMLATLGLIPQPPGRIAGGTAILRTPDKPDGRDLLQMTPAEKRKLRGSAVSMIFQDPMTSLNPYLRVGRQLDEVLETHRDMTKPERYKRCIQVMRDVGLPEPEKRFKQYPHQLSGGMRQRVMIAMALLCEPDLLIADEPTTALDVTIQAQILSLFRRLREQHNTAILFITHDLGVVAGITDRVLVMYAGSIMERADTSSLYRAPSHPYTMGLMRSVPRVDVDEVGATATGDASAARRQKLIPIPGLPPDLRDEQPGCPFAARCPFVEQRCVDQAPPVVEFEPGHTSACHRATEVREMSPAQRDAAAAAKADQLTRAGL